MCSFACLGFSATFHTLLCHSPNVFHFCCRLDYTGTSILITGSYLPVVYYSFYCHVTTIRIYIATILTLSAICAALCMAEKFQRPEYRTTRGLLFISFAQIGAVIMIHHIIMNGVKHSFTDGQFQWVCTIGVIYISGTVFFMSRFPECFWPGRFNLVLHSHQIWHVMVVAGLLVHTYMIFNMRYIRLKLGDICTD